MCAILSQREIQGLVDPFKSIAYLKTTRIATNERGQSRLLSPLRVKGDRRKDT
jgi:hypothetical protein